MRGLRPAPRADVGRPRVAGIWALITASATLAVNLQAWRQIQLIPHWWKGCLGEVWTISIAPGARSALMTASGSDAQEHRALQVGLDEEEESPS